MHLKICWTSNLFVQYQPNLSNGWGLRLLFDLTQRDILQICLFENWFRWMMKFRFKIPSEDLMRVKLDVWEIGQDITSEKTPFLISKDKKNWKRCDQSPSNGIHHWLVWSFDESFGFSCQVRTVFFSLVVVLCLNQVHYFWLDYVTECFSTPNWQLSIIYHF